MTELDEFKSLNMIKTGHFLLPSGKHSDTYFQCSQLSKYPDKLNKVLKKVIQDPNLSDFDFDLVVSPAIGGIVIGYELARLLHKPFLFLERVDGNMVLNQPFDKTLGSVLIAEDVITSGRTIIECIQLLENLGGAVKGIVCVINKESIVLSVPIYSFLSLHFKSFSSNTCPLCTKNIILKTGKEL